MFSADLGVNQVASNPPATDPPFQKVALLLHGDGTNGAQNNTFVDSSTNNFTITRTGNVAQGTFSPFSLPEGKWSNYFDGTSYLTTPNSAFTALGTNDWTVEFWVYPLAASAGTVFANNANGIGFQFDCQAGVGVTRIRFTIDGGATKQMDATGVNMNVWTHFAMVRSGNNLYMYVNGTRVTSSTTTASIANSATLSYIGNGYGSSLFNGYISNLRMINGTAIYSGASLTVPTAPLTAVTNTNFLTCQSNRFVDNSVTNATFTTSGSPKVTAFSPFAPSAAYDASTNGGSGYWSATTGQYLTSASSSAYNAGTNDFTIEGFIYYNSASYTSYYNTIFNLSNYGTGILLRIPNASSVQLYILGNVYSISLGYTLSNYSWHHISVTRQSGSLYCFIDGIRVGSLGTNSSNISPNDVIYIGNSVHSGFAEGGVQYISNVRYVVGTAIYTTATYTVPTAPLTAVANTQLLLNCTNAGIIDNAGKNDIETVGNAQISTSVKKYGTGSMAFDGTGDYLVNQGNIDSFIFSTGDWTIEFWLYLNSIPSVTTYILDFRPTSTQGVYPTIYITSAGNLVFFVSSGLRINASAAISAGAWQHVAICKSNGSTKAFVNGTQVGSTYTDTNSYLCGANRPAIASNGYTLNNGLLTGYIDDLRITRGQALYTSNFTPPTQAFPNV